MKGLLICCVAVSSAAALHAGELTRREQIALERVVQGGPPRYDLDFLLADLIPKPGRRFTEFSGDLSGRYLEALAAMGQLHRAGALPQRIFDLQRPDGGFANPISLRGAVRDDDMARVWGHGRLLVGLLAAYEAARDERALETARRLGDFLVEVSPRFLDSDTVDAFSSGRLAHGYICWTQNLEGLADLYKATEESSYLELAQAIAELIERQPGQHSHGWLTSLRGLLILTEVTGDDRYLQQAEQAWEALTASENVLLTGAIPEYFAPGISRDEGCSQADWVRLNLSLWRRTGEERYIEMAERALFNAFFLNQFASGDFGHVQLGAEGLEHGVANAWWCCTLHGLRAFPAVRQAAFRTDGAAVRYDLPVDSEIQHAGLGLRADADLAREMRVRFQVLAAGAEAVRLEIRRPSWSGPLESSLGGDTASGSILLERVWRGGETLTIRYSPRERREGTSLFLGPWLLAVSEAASPRFFDEPHHNNRILWETLGPGNRPSRRTVKYIPAGYPEQHQSVVLRPVAERLDLPDGLRWQWSFRQDRSRIERTASRIVEQSRGQIAPFLAGIALGALGIRLLRRRRSADAD